MSAPQPWRADHTAAPAGSRRSIASWLMLLVLVATLPTLLVGALALREAEHANSIANNLRLRDQASALVADFDDFLRKRAALLHALVDDVDAAGISPEALETLRRRTTRLAEQRGGPIALWAMEGATPRLLFRTSEEPAIDQAIEANTPALGRAPSLRRDHLGDLITAPGLAHPILPLMVPVERDGALLLVFTMFLDPQRFVAQTARPGEHFTGGDAVLLAPDDRLTAQWGGQRPLGQPMPEAFRRASAAREGDSFQVAGGAEAGRYALVQSNAFPRWAAVVGAPPGEAWLLGSERMTWLLMAAAVAGLLSTALGAAICRRIAQPAAAMARLAETMGGEPRALPAPSGVAEFEAVQASISLADREMRNARRRIAIMVDAAGLGLWDHELGGGRIFWSRHLFAMMGLAPRESGYITVSDMMALIHPEDQDAYRRALLALRRDDRESYIHRVRIIRPDTGEIRWMEAHGRMLGPVGQREFSHGVVIDITDRMGAEAATRLLAREVDHRANNLLAVVQAVIRLSRARDDSGLRGEIERRVMSLARSHSLLAGQQWRPCPLRQLLEGEVAVLGERAALQGPDILLPPGLVQNLGLIIHELATNALKHGAGSTEGGRLALRWLRSEDELVLRWQESGGPVVAEPRRAGFGQRMMEASAAAMQGRIRHEWHGDGLVSVLCFPLQPPEALPPPARLPAVSLA